MIGGQADSPNYLYWVPRGVSSFAGTVTKMGPGALKSTISKLMSPLLQATGGAFRDTFGADKNGVRFLWPFSCSPRVALFGSWLKLRPGTAVVGVRGDVPLFGVKWIPPKVMNKLETPIYLSDRVRTRLVPLDNLAIVNRYASLRIWLISSS